MSLYSRLEIHVLAMRLRRFLNQNSSSLTISQLGYKYLLFSSYLVHVLIGNVSFAQSQHSCFAGIYNSSVVLVHLLGNILFAISVLRSLDLFIFCSFPTALAARSLADILHLGCVFSSDMTDFLLVLYTLLCCISSAISILQHYKVTATLI